MSSATPNAWKIGEDNWSEQSENDVPGATKTFTTPSPVNNRGRIVKVCSQEMNMTFNTEDLDNLDKTVDSQKQEGSARIGTGEECQKCKNGVFRQIKSR